MILGIRFKENIEKSFIAADLELRPTSHLIPEVNHSPAPFYFFTYIWPNIHAGKQMYMALITIIVYRNQILAFMSSFKWKKYLNN